MNELIYLPGLRRTGNSRAAELNLSEHTVKKEIFVSKEALSA